MRRKQQHPPPAKLYAPVDPIVRCGPDLLFPGLDLQICSPCVSPIIFLSLLVASVRARYRLIEFQPSATFCRKFRQPYGTYAAPKRPAYPICFALTVCACNVKRQTRVVARRTRYPISIIISINWLVTPRLNGKVTSKSIFLD